MSDKNLETKQPITFNTLATAGNAGIDINTFDPIVIRDLPTVLLWSNIQLNFWIEAKRHYAQHVQHANLPDPAHLIFLIVLLGNSLVFLLAANHVPRPKAKKTPKPMDMARGDWQMHKKNPSLFREIEAMYQFYENLIKHPDQAKIDTILTGLTKESVTKHMETVRQTWIWVIEKSYEKRRLSVPPEQLREFDPVE